MAGLLVAVDGDILPFFLLGPALADGKIFGLGHLDLWLLLVGDVEALLALRLGLILVLRILLPPIFGIGTTLVLGSLLVVGCPLEFLQVAVLVDQIVGALGLLQIDKLFDILLGLGSVGHLGFPLLPNLVVNAIPIFDAGELTIELVQLG